MTFQNTAFVHDEKKNVNGDGPFVDANDLSPVEKLNGNANEKRASFNETPPLPDIYPAKQSGSNISAKNGTYNGTWRLSNHF